MLEMQIVIRTVLTRRELRAASQETEAPTRRNITVRPGGGAVASLDDRVPAAVPAG